MPEGSGCCSTPAPRGPDRRRDGWRIAALREIVAQLLQYQQPLRHTHLNLMYGLNTCYDTGTADPHPLVSRWAPDLALATTDRAASVAAVAPGTRRAARPHPGRRRWAGQGWRDRIDIRTARCPSLPASALLIRPDGCVACVASATDAGDDGTGDDGTLRDALASWFGAPKAD